MNRIRLTFVASLTMVISGVITMAAATPATAATPANNPCPTSPNGPGGILRNFDGGLDLLVNSSQSIMVLQDNVNADVVCTSPSTGSSFINDDGTVYYGSGMFDLGTVGHDSFIVGAVKDGDYYTVSVTVNVFAVPLSEPTVIRKAKLKNGKVVKAAIVSFPNPTTDYMTEVMAGDFHQPVPDVTRRVAPNTSIEIKTKRKRLDFVQLILDNGALAANSLGQINTLTGGVTMQNLWYDRLNTSNQHLAKRWGKLG